MKKIALFLAFVPLFAIGQQAEKTFKIVGKATGLAYKTDWVYLQYRTNGEWKKDSVQPKNGKYIFTGKTAEPMLARLTGMFREDSSSKKIATNFQRDVAAVFIQAGKIKVMSVDSFSNIIVKGSPAHTAYNKLNELGKPYDERMKPLIDQYRAYGKAKDTENQSKVENEIDALQNEKNEKVYGEFAKSNPSSPLAMYALQQYAGWDINAEKVEPIFNALSMENRNYPSAVEFKENLEIAKKTGIGQYAMEFTQNDTLDIPVSLSSFKGKLLLVDFWASWCGPCRAENPNVVKVFNQYKNNNFHVLGVSLDRPGQKEKWMKAIHDDKLEWTHVSDLKFWNNEVAMQYGIKAIPQNLLIDEDGKIVAKNIRGEELAAKVSEIIEGKKAFAPKP